MMEFLRDIWTSGKGVWRLAADRMFAPGYWATLPAAGVDYEGALARDPNGVWACQPNGAGGYIWVRPGTGLLGVLGIYQDSNYTGANSNAAQKIFNESTNGAANVAASTAYLMDAVIHIHTTGLNSASISLGFGGTATLTSIAYMPIFINPATETTSSGAIAAGWITTASMSVVAGAVATERHFTVFLHGLVRVNAEGTFIPQYQFSAAPGVAPVTLTNSWLQLTPLGTNTVTTVGPWS